ncbi:hypothetical protein TrRE_jg3665 [Triparma retinervis]|uniref:Secreted protein n=1 Tax=Triparma retinervis TaxID=2557542 RepID=A0A9W6ZL40_9STRA|nr:hypothetical protein TrRE_jg3665 [Triparma retinervis]
MNTISLLSLLSLLLLATSGAAAPKAPKKPKKAKNSKTLGSNTVIAGATCWTELFGVNSNVGNLYVDFGTTGYASFFEVAPGSGIQPGGPDGYDYARYIAFVYQNPKSAKTVNAAIVVNNATYIVTADTFTNPNPDTLTSQWQQQGEQAEVPVPSVPEESAIDCTVFVGESSIKL